jgi:hypothetical protein
MEPCKTLGFGIVGSGVAALMHLAGIGFNQAKGAKLVSVAT